MATDKGVASEGGPEPALTDSSEKLMLVTDWQTGVLVAVVSNPL